MALGFPGKEPVQRLIDRRGASAAQKVAELHPLVVSEAAEDGARCRDPDAIAAVAEIVRQRRNEAEPDAEPVHIVIASWAAGANERRNQSELLREMGADL